MDSHSPGLTGLEWNESSAVRGGDSGVGDSRDSDSPPAYKSASPNSSPASSLTDHSHDQIVSDYSSTSPSHHHHHHHPLLHHHPMHHHEHHHQFDLSSQMIETKRSFSLCALSLSNSSEADLSSGNFEPRSFRPFKSNEEYLVAMREDLAEWLNTIYSGLELNADNFLAQLQTGVTLCRHANSVLQKIRDWRDADRRSPFKKFSLEELDLERDVVFRANAQAGTFHARDNVANFITWCRRIRIHECLLFETEDLVLKKNEKSFVLCLLEVARYGAKFGVLAPTLVQFEQEIDRELAKEEDNCSRGDCENESVDSGVATPEQQPEGLFGEDEPQLLLPYGPQPQISNNDLESLHEKVVKLLNKCACPVQFHLEHLSEGKYRIDGKTLIFVRILRNHVMVRVGGGWDTLENYLEKHDPCRGRAAQRSYASHSRSNVMRATSGVSVRNDRHEFTTCNSASTDHRSHPPPTPVTASNRPPQRSVNSSPVPTRRSIVSSNGPTSCESLSSSPSEVASSLASSQNSIASNGSSHSSGAAISNTNKTTKLDRNNNLKGQRRTISAVGNCKRMVESSRIPKLGKPPSGAHLQPGSSSPLSSPNSSGLLPAKTRSTSALSLVPGCSSQQNGTPKGSSRIPSLVTPSPMRQSTTNLHSPPSSARSLRSLQSSDLSLSARQKQRSTMELRTPTPPIYQQQSPFSTSSLHRRNLSFGGSNRKLLTTPPPQQSPNNQNANNFNTKSPSPLTVGGPATGRRASAPRQSLPSSPVMTRKDLASSRRSPSLVTVPVELSRLERHHSGSSSLGSSSASSTASSSFSSLTTAVPKSDYRSPQQQPVSSGVAGRLPPQSRAKQQLQPLKPKNTALVDVSSWLERNQLTSS